MTDLSAVLPGFPTQQYVRLLSSLEKSHVTTADLLTLDGVEIAKRAQLPLPEVKRLHNAILQALQATLGVSGIDDTERLESSLRKTGGDLVGSWRTISTLDDQLDIALGGGIATGCITEVTGESGAGKTQFLLTLLLSVQLPPPRGVSGAALYISTESALPTTRLSQMLRLHRVLTSASQKPTLDSVISIVTPDLESQDHILRYQVPVAIRQYGIRLIVLDSVAANYRAEFDRPGNGATTGQTSGANMAQRSSELVKLGQLLRDIAREHNIAIVVANQVADRFSTNGANHGPSLDHAPRGSPARRDNTVPSDSAATTMPSTAADVGLRASTFSASTTDPVSLDHQQRWFTGWGDDRYPSYSTLKNLKTPSLGLIWTTQIACRIALIRRPVYGPGPVDEDERGELVLKRWRRWMKIVFASHTSSTGPGLDNSVEFEIKGEGLRTVEVEAGDGANIDDNEVRS